MKKILCLFGCLFFGSANATLIDFDTLPGGGVLSSGTSLTNQYASEGVLFSAFENGSLVDNTVVGNLVGSNYWYNCYPTICGSRADILRIDFDSLVDNVSWVTDTEGTPPGSGIIFNAYDSIGSLIDSTSITISGTAISTSFSVSGISYIEMLQASDSWAWGIDNLSFDATTVPEPTSIILLGLGLAGIGLSKKRKSA
jgi:hypothetical protein